MDSKPLLPSSFSEMQMPELSNTVSSSSRIASASLIFLMLMSSIVFSILSDAVDNQFGFFVRSSAFLTFRAAVAFGEFSDASD